MNLVAPFGVYSAGNIGDEATLQGFAQLLRHQDGRFRVRVASLNPVHSSHAEPTLEYYSAREPDWRAWWALRIADGYIFPGGTPIMDVLGPWPLSEVVPLVRRAHRRRKPIAFVGIGAEDLQRDDSKRLVSQELAPCVRHWSVRCERDKKRLLDYGVTSERVTVASDLAWMLDPVCTDFGRHCLARCGLNSDATFVGVNVNSETSILKREPRMFDKLASLVDALVEKFDVSILFLCNEVRDGESYDKAASLRVLATMQHKDRAFLVPNQYWTPQEMLSLIACCHVTISTRYHFCLLSALQGVPFIALKRSDKVDDLCWDISWPNGAFLFDLSVPTLLEMFSDIQNRRPFLVEHLHQHVKHMRDRALINNVALDALL